MPRATRARPTLAAQTVVKPFSAITKCQEKHWRMRCDSCTFFLRAVLISSKVIYAGYFHSWVTLSRIREELVRRLDIPSTYVDLIHKSKILDRNTGQKKRLWDYITHGRCELTFADTARSLMPRPLRGEFESEDSMPSLTSSSDSP